jgi:hypothetical protein
MEHIEIKAHLHVRLKESDFAFKCDFNIELWQHETLRLQFKMFVVFYHCIKAILCFEIMSKVRSG